MQIRIQKKNLNRNDHKKVDNAAKGVRVAGEVGAIILAVAGVTWKVVKTVGKTVTKV